MHGKNSITLTAVGDVMLSRQIQDEAPHHQASWFFEDVADLLRGDIVFGNLESVISDKGSERDKRITFRAAPSMLDVLAAGNFTHLSVINNHSLDWGEEAWRDSFHRLSEQGYHLVGSLRRQQHPVYTTVKGLRCAFLAYDFVGSAYDITEHLHDIRDLEPHDFLIISAHWGREYKPHTKRQTRVGRAFIDAGADVVIGHHPHWVQEVERYNGGLIFYSLGNFLFDQYWGVKTQHGVIAHIQLQVDGESEFELFETNTFKKKITLGHQPE